MNSENTINPILCANGCGFFGTASTMNLCSKCYRDLRLSEEQAASAKAAVEKSMSPPETVISVSVEEKPVEIAGGVVEEKEEAENCCGRCEKKIPVLGFKCRCGITFCRSHRFPDQHECAFDFKGAGKDAIAKANPVVKADKVDRF